jgi:Chloride channel protein EriC
MIFTDKLFQDERVSRARHKILFNLPFWIGAGLIALVSVGYNKLFAICEEFALRHAHDGLLLWTAPLALLASFLIGHFFSKEAIGSGIPQVIVSVELAERKSSYLEKLLSIPMLLAKIAGSCICVLGGGITGREGPTLQVSAAIFYQLNRIWPKSLARPQLPAFILAGGAAGLASAFNTPLGGVVFAIEELAKTHISLIRTAIFQAVIIAGILAQIFLGNYLYIGETHFGQFPFATFVQTILIAAIVGAISSVFSEGLYRITKWRAKQNLTLKIVMTLLCGVALSGVYYFCGSETAGAGKTIMQQLLDPNTVAVPDFLLPIARILGNFFTYIGGVIGGVFAPSLASGAALGQQLSLLFGFESVRLMVLVGMVAFLTGLTRTPFTSFVLVLEMSSSHEVILYLMLSSIVANLAAKLCFKDSFYEQAAHDIITRVMPPEAHASVASQPHSVANKDSI